MRKNRKIMIVVILIIAAIITPPDVFSQILVAIPLFGLYELSILISDRVFKKTGKRNLDLIQTSKTSVVIILIIKSVKFIFICYLFNKKVFELKI